GGTFFLPRLVGLPRAAAMMLLGEKIPAAEALGMGMIYKVYPPESLPEEALKLARHLAAQPTRGLGLTKRLLNQSLQNDLETQLNQEAELQAAAGATEDYQEGVQAFLEKRKANFKGR
ncbi:MAG: 2-(1,2-epoxy-1,2-dihydrophenyl)acetyl-CoA isomerase, partial [Calditrichaeota bacterium]|nr:2-(1,2-epoxy-1,2-dihydrophenyl)acetyl-CoA isomerase [Calditrichota bacterium]